MNANIPAVRLSRNVVFRAIVGIVIVLAAATSIRQVNTGQLAVVTRFGKVINRELGEGIHLVMPFGIDRVSRYDVKVQKDESEVSAASKDLQDVTGTVALNYRIDAARVSQIHQEIGPNFALKLIDPALQETFKATSAKYSASELITNRSEVKNEALKGVKERLEQYGIMVDDLSIVNFKFSPAFAKAIEEKQVAQQNAERSRFNLEAAQIDAQAQQAQAQTLSPLFLQKQAIEKWNGEMPQYLGNGTVFNIPLQ
jgi:prohibitin 1